MDYCARAIHLPPTRRRTEAEYKREAFELFGTLLERIKPDTISLLSRVQSAPRPEIEEQERERGAAAGRRLQMQHAPAVRLSGDAAPVGPESAAAAAAGRRRDRAAGRSRPAAGRAARR